jgi:DNA ligase-associated metallophosphoesterase
MTHHAFSFHGQTLHARASGALWWPDARVLVIGDLHFGKAQRAARRGGGLLPPYEMAETLARLDAEIAATDPATVIALGDSFDDPEAEARMMDRDAEWLARLMAGREWVWVTGNHDPGPVETGGSLRAEWHHGGLAFRHIATDATPEVSAHYHPKARLAGTARPCFLIDAQRIILPAFGAYTGGLDTRRAPLPDLMGPDALAVLTGTRARPVPMPRASFQD